eukprot:CAMPEP_0185033040 /NCGR_PEP_ID=MMETSP1103-20130426/21659_1 /TAXON_ID=36769 /ORGANISM="Paraphysomonas bandaiensis, Strain Caron Lab Isolate" /LENGTH=745 /DNA_ID=CAMNT_0027569175 /DNA_START=59 /DNA_END=2296 /DNA_ORIENTATION=-
MVAEAEIQLEKLTLRKRFLNLLLENLEEGDNVEVFKHLTSQPVEIEFSDHDFIDNTSFNEIPSECINLFRSWSFKLSDLPSKRLHYVTKNNSLDGIAASPGEGKSHFIDTIANDRRRYEIVEKWSVDNRLKDVNICKLSFNCPWEFMNDVENTWTMEQQVIGRIICVKLGCIDWENFCKWFQKSSLFDLTFAVFTGKYLNLSLNTMILVDEIVLFQGNNTSSDKLSRICSMLCRWSDASFLNTTHLSRTLVFISSLKVDYLCDMLTATKRHVRLFRPDALRPHEVISPDQFSGWVARHGDVVNLMFNMCGGHPRYIAKVKQYLNACHIRNSGLEVYIGGCFNEKFANRGLFVDSKLNMYYFAPVFLELPLSVKGKSFGIDGGLSVYGGFYANRFEKIDQCTTFVPEMTVWHFVALWQSCGFASYTLPSRSLFRVEDVHCSILRLKQSIYSHRADALDDIIVRMLHARVDAILTAKRMFADALELEFCGMPTSGIEGFAQHVPFIRAPSNCTYNLELCPDAGLSELKSIGHRYVETFPEHFVSWFSEKSDCESQHDVMTENDFDGDISDDDEVFEDEEEQTVVDAPSFDWFFSESIATLISPFNKTNMDIDCALRLKSSKMGITLLIQGKRYDSYPGAAAVRKWVNKLEKSADTLMGSLSDGHADTNEMCVLMVVLMLKKDRHRSTADIMEKCKFHQPKLYTKKSGGKGSLPVVRYPLILLGNSELCSLLGPSFYEYLLSVILSEN